MSSFYFLFRILCLQIVAFLVISFWAKIETLETFSVHLYSEALFAF